MNSTETHRPARWLYPNLRRSATLDFQRSALNLPVMLGFKRFGFLIILVAIVSLVGIPLPTPAQPTNAVPPYDALYCFGFSWTDTQGLFPNGSPDLVNNKPQYWQNRAS